MTDIRNVANGDREANRQTVETYLASVGEMRRERPRLFARDGEAGLWTSDRREPIVTKGTEALAKHAEWSLKCFPDWRWYNVRIFQTDDPYFLWAECDGRGTIRFEGYPEGIYENHFIHSFEFVGRLIRRQREFMNPLRQYEALGIEVPTIVRRGMPE